jgi:hypothetical protein
LEVAVGKKSKFYLVVLSPKSELGEIYAKPRADFTEKHLQAPVLRCSEVEFTDYGWLRLTRLRQDAKSTFPTMTVHGSDVIAIHEWMLDDDVPAGFVPVRATA